MLDLFEGRVGTYQNLSLSDEAHEAQGKAADALTELLKILGPLERDVFDRFLSASEEENMLEGDSYYLSGFKLGVLLGIEISDLSEWK